MRQAMLLNGVDWWGFAGMTSCEHTDDVIDAHRAGVRGQRRGDDGGGAGLRQKRISH